MSGTSPGEHAEGAADSERSVEQASSPAGSSGGSLFQHLMALQELQANLSQEQQPEAILKVGTVAVVEILGADCGLGLIDPLDGQAELRFGWCEGRAMAQHEVEMLSRSLGSDLERIRSGNRTRVLLATETGEAGPEPDGEPPVPFQSRQLGSVLILGIGNSGLREGSLVLGRRDGAPFTREQVVLADLLASQIAAQFERVRRPFLNIGEDAPSPAPVDQAAVPLRERNQELEALQAVQYAVNLSFDAETQIDGALHKAVEVTGHSAGAIYLVEMENSGEEVLRLARGMGDQESLEAVRHSHLRKGEGVPGRVWAGGEPVVVLDLLNEPDMTGSDMLYGAGYRKMLCLPLRARGRIVGVLELLGSDETPYAEAELRVARGIAEQIALVSHDARLISDLMRHSLELEQQLGRQNRELQRRGNQFRAVLGALSATGRVEEGSREYDETLLGCALDLLESAGGTLHVIDGESRVMRLCAHRGLPQGGHERLSELPTSDPVLERAISVPGAARVDLEEMTEPDRARWSDVSGSACLTVIACRSGNGEWGVLSIAANRHGAPADDEVEALQGIAGLIGRSLEVRGTAARPDPGFAAQMEAAGGLPAAPLLQAQLTQAQRMESIGTLARGIAHNFNNILAGISGHASLIRTMVPDGDPIHGKVAIIEEQSLRAAELTRQLVVFTSGGKGVREPVDVNRLIEETVSFLSKSLDPTVIVEALYAPDLPPVEADAGQLRQVLLNIAVNARDAMTTGGRITFQSRMGHLDEGSAKAIPGLGPGDYVAIVISDSGPGMSREVMERVFEPFFTTKTAGEGTGLGLSVAHGIIKNHHGHVAISSTPGVGTAVCLYLPAASTPVDSPGEDAAGHTAGPAGEDPPLQSAPSQIDVPGRGESDEVARVEEEQAEALGPVPEAAETNQPEEPEEPTEEMVAEEPATSERAPVEGESAPVESASVPAANGSCVLVVDDEEVVRHMAAEILRAGGYEVMLARDGVEALDLYRQNWGKIHVVLLDMVMPRLSGLETFRRILGMDRRARVVLYSGYSESEQAQKAIREGAIGMLAKPSGMGELLGWVARALKQER